MIKGCKAQQFRDHYWCNDCRACWDLNGGDRSGCKMAARELARYYAPLVVLAAVAVSMVATTIAAIVVGGVLFAYALAAVS